MATDADPLRHTYYCLRRVLATTLGEDPHSFHPRARLEDLIPPKQRRQTWKKLRRAGLRLPSLCLPPGLAGVAHVAFALKLVATIAAQQWLAWLLFVPLTFLTWLVIRPYAVHVNRCGPMTLWDAAIYLTPYKGHADHPWSQREIETKVRLVLAEALGVPLEQIRRESRLTDLIAC